MWAEQNQVQAWRDVELAACRVWSDIGGDTSEVVDKLYENASFDMERIKVIEKETQHDVDAFTRAVSETLGEEKKWIHYGLTSTDVVDTANGYRLKQANQLIYKGMDRLLEPESVR